VTGMTGRSVGPWFVGFVAAITVVACGGDDGGGGSAGGGSDSISGMLAEIPEPDERAETDVIVYTDLDRATELAGVERPAADEVDIDAILPWLGPLTGFPGEDGGSDVAVFPPSLAIGLDGLRHNEEVDDELGWNLRDVHSFIEYQVPPNLFLVADADVDADDLTKAIGEPEDGIWYLGGADGESSIGDRTPARPFGESLRIALDDDLVAMARTTPPVEAWLADDGPTMADDADLLAAAEALDVEGVYTAALLAGDLSSYPGDDQATLVEFESMGLGLDLEEDQAIVVLVYVHADEEDAAANEELVTDLLAKGTAAAGPPYTELFELRDTKLDGRVLTVTLALVDGTDAARVLNLVVLRDSLTVHAAAS
jgi:hypothetical protein